MFREHAEGVDFESWRNKANFGLQSHFSHWFCTKQKCIVNPNFYWYNKIPHWVVSLNARQKFTYFRCWHSRLTQSLLHISQHFTIFKKEDWSLHGTSLWSIISHLEKISSLCAKTVNLRGSRRHLWFLYSYMRS